VICELMGLPLADARRLEGWTGALLRLFQAIPSQRTLEGMERALGEFRDYLAAEVDARLRDPGPDLTSRLARDMEALAPFDRTCLIDNCMLLIADAVENVDAAISNALSALLRHPDQIELLQARPDLITPAVEECLRFEPPNQFIGRVAARDLTLRGREIHEGSVVLLVLASANRDEARFENPDHFDIARKDTTHLGVGRGRHFCIGAQLVRMEMAAALGTVVRRLHDLELQDGALRWQTRTGHRWLVDLPVTFAPA
jgi:cytochrome P450